MRDSFSDGFFAPEVRETHPVELMCRYLWHGSVERMPGLPAHPEALSFEYLARHVRAGDRARYDDADAFSLYSRRKVRGRLYGLEFRICFVAGEPYADAVIPFGAPVDLPRFLRRLRGRPGGAAGDWDFEVHTDAGDLRESVLLFGNRREVRFRTDRGRLTTGRLHGNRFGTSTLPYAGGVLFPDGLAAVPATSPEGRAHHRYVVRLHGPRPWVRGVRRAGAGAP
ncbi:hypothetical protein ACIQBJ_14345 [Kitasatospora sp. NPDC088391]|uniref:hypothetical protein n=1 Tax=Kitasatospora sp. NPDC088391 TaxID=3364074 RepID=UPI003814429F